MNTVERVAQALRQNPEGVLLLGASVALMLRNATTSGGATSQPKQAAPASKPRYGGAGNDESPASGGLSGNVSATAEDVRAYMVDTAQDLTDRVSEYGQSATKRTKQAAESAYRSAEQALEAHPIAIAIAGVAAGCLAAAIFPSTRYERDTLGPIGRQAANAAAETGELVKSVAIERVASAAVKVGEQLKDAAVEGKLGVGTLGEVARDLATDFTDGVTGALSGTRPPVVKAQL